MGKYRMGDRIRMGFIMIRDRMGDNIDRDNLLYGA